MIKWFTCIIGLDALYTSLLYVLVILYVYVYYMYYISISGILNLIFRSQICNHFLIQAQLSFIFQWSFFLSLLQHYFIFQSCHSKVSQVGWLSRQKLFLPLRNVEVRLPRSMCQQEFVCSEDPSPWIADACLLFVSSYGPCYM